MYTKNVLLRDDDIYLLTILMAPLVIDTSNHWPPILFFYDTRLQDNLAIVL